MSSILTKNQRRRLRLKKKKDGTTDTDAEFDQIIKEQQDQLVGMTAINTSQSTPSTLSDVPNQTEQPKTETITITREQITGKAKQFWNDIRQYIKEHPEFKDLEDKSKLEFCRTKLGYGQFMDEFPIVSRYMVCVGQFNMKAFVRFLDKCEKTVHPPVAQREKGYNEDQWIRRQADYVQYLWESYQKPHYNNAERQYIWQNTYKLLKGEFDDFRDMHKDIEERVKEEKTELQAQNVRELLERIKTGEQRLSPEQEEELLAALEHVVNERKNAKPESDGDTKQDRTHSNEPTNRTDVVDSEGRTKITVIETVTEEQMQEIDPNYKPSGVGGSDLTANIDPFDMDDCEILTEEEVK
jgi:hypothetical protein